MARFFVYFAPEHEQALVAWLRGWGIATPGERFALDADRDPDTGDPHLPKLHQGYVVVHAPSEQAARRMVWEELGNQWAGIHTSVAYLPAEVRGAGRIVSLRTLVQV